MRVALHPSSWFGTRSDRASEHVPDPHSSVCAPCLRPFYKAVPFSRLLRLFTGSSTLIDRARHGAQSERRAKRASGCRAAPAVLLVEHPFDARHDDPRHPFELLPVALLRFPGEEAERFADPEGLELVVHGERFADPVGDPAAFRKGKAPGIDLFGVVAGDGDNPLFRVQGELGEAGPPSDSVTERVPSGKMIRLSCFSQRAIRLNSATFSITPSYCPG